MMMGEEIQVLPAPSTGGDWTDKIMSIIPQALQYQQQRDLIKLNAELIKQGKPPIAAGQLAPQVNFGVSPEIQRLLMWGAIGLGAYAVARLVMRR